MEIKEANENNFNDLVENKEVLIDFYATWCGPCKMLSLELEKLKEKIQIIKVNIDDNMGLCKKYGIISVPTLIHLKKDGNYDITVGYISSDKIIEWIKK